MLAPYQDEITSSSTAQHCDLRRVSFADGTPFEPGQDFKIQNINISIISWFKEHLLSRDGKVLIATERGGFLETYSEATCVSIPPLAKEGSHITIHVKGFSATGKVPDLKLGFLHVDVPKTILIRTFVDKCILDRGWEGLLSPHWLWHRRLPHLH